MAQEVAALLLLLLAERSELAAGDPMSRRIPRRVGGAVAALEADPADPDHGP